MKQIIIVLSALLLFSAITVGCKNPTEPSAPSTPGTSETSETPAEFFTYITNNGEITITGYTGAFADIAIPKTIDEFPVTTILSNAFTTNTTIETVYASSVLHINNGGHNNGAYGAFSGSTNLKSITFPNATNIGNHAFRYCSNLANANFPRATTISENAFENCVSLTNASFPLVTTIGSYAFNNCSNLANANAPLATTISAYAFFNCLSLTNASFPLATAINTYAFYYCESLMNANFPLATMIGSFAFCNCISLTNAQFGAVTNIGNFAFGDCEALQTVTISNATPPSMGTTPFNNAGTNRTLYVPSSAVSAYEAAGWKTTHEFKRIFLIE